VLEDQIDGRVAADEFDDIVAEPPAGGEAERCGIEALGGGEVGGRRY
jgi:hypothetical protein